MTVHEFENLLLNPITPNIEIDLGADENNICRLIILEPIKKQYFEITGITISDNYDAIILRVKEIN